MATRVDPETSVDAAASAGTPSRALEQPRVSHLSMAIRSSTTTSSPLASAPSAGPSHQLHPPHLSHLAAQIHHNLQHQHDWTSLTVHTHSPLSPHTPLSRPLISGLPPSRIYIHPDEQVELLKRGDRAAETRPEREWVLPTKLREPWTLRQFAEVFDSIAAVPPGGVDDVGEEQAEQKAKTSTRAREKRVLLATVSDDSTVVYYIVHEGIVKPRQN